MGANIDIHTAEAVDRYLETLVNLRPETVRGRASKLRQYARAAPVLGDPGEAHRYLLRRRERLADATYRSEWQALRHFHAWASAEYGIRDPFERGKPPRKAKTIPVRLDEHEAAAILQAAEDSGRPDLHAMAMLLLGVGLRIGELAALRRSRIGRRVIVIPDGKTGQREVPVPDARFNELVAQIGRDDYLWVTKDGKPRSVKGLTNTWRRLCRRVGVTGRKAGPHAARHRVGKVVIKKAGADLRTVQWLLGHADVSSTLVYAGLEPDEVLDRWDELSPLAGLHTTRTEGLSEGFGEGLSVTDGPVLPQSSTETPPRLPRALHNDVVESVAFGSAGETPSIAGEVRRFPGGSPEVDGPTAEQRRAAVLAEVCGGPWRTAHEIARALGRTPAAVLTDIIVLRRDGLVGQRGPARAREYGRPEVRVRPERVAIPRPVRHGRPLLRLVKPYRDRVERDFGELLTAERFDVLVWLREAGEMAAWQMAIGTGMEQGRVTALLVSMEQDGIVRRKKWEGDVPFYGLAPAFRAWCKANAPVRRPAG